MNKPLEMVLVFSILSMALGLVIAGLGMFFQHRRQKMWHETARLALEKGLPVPDAVDLSSDHTSKLTPHEKARNRQRGLLIAGLINIATGAGLFVALQQISPQTSFFGAIPAFIGVALCLSALADIWLTGKSSK